VARGEVEVVLERTVCELRGVCCIHLERGDRVQATNYGIASFGHDVDDIQELKATGNLRARRLSGVIPGFYQ
jgi:hypothetical protein